MAKKSGEKTGAVKKATERKKPAKTKKKSADTQKGGAASARQVPLVSLAEVASMLKMHPLQVRKLAQAGKIPAVKVEGEWKFNKDLVYQAYHQRAQGR